METSAELFRQINFKQIFKEFNKGKKRKLTASEKRRFKLLIRRHFPVTSEDARNLSKALEVGGTSLRAEPLDQTLKMVTFDDTKLVLQKSLQPTEQTGFIGRLKKWLING